MDVTREDQDKINAFSRLNNKKDELQAKIKILKTSAEDLEDAGNEVMLLDDDTVPYVIGECFVHMPREEAEEKLASQLEETQGQLTEVESELRKIQLEMTSLKTVLYGKFGDTINLEE